MLEASQRLKKEAAKIGCNANHIILADLILSGYTEAEAYDIAYSENVTWNAQRKIAHRESQFASEQYKRAYDIRKDARGVNIEAAESRDKDAVEQEINNLINQTRDPKLKADLLMKLADLKQMKKDASSSDEDPVQFFLSIDCVQCPLLDAYNSYIAKRNEEKPEKDWSAGVRPDEMQMIIETVIPKMERLQKARF